MLSSSCDHAQLDSHADVKSPFDKYLVCAFAMGLDVNVFYIERDSILNQPDEDLNDYCRRILSRNTEFHLTGPDVGFAPFLEEEDIVSLYSNEMGSCDKLTTPSREQIATAPSPTSQHSGLVKNVEEVHGSDARYHFRVLSSARRSDYTCKQL